MNLPPAEPLVARLRELQRLIRTQVIAGRGKPNLHQVDRQSQADTIYQLDVTVEEVVIDYCEHWGRETPLVVVAEGIEPESGRVFPETSRQEDATFRLLLDPIDGTRGLMYDKRSAWSLAGIAPNHGADTRLSHIELAVMTELPTSKMSRADVLWALRGQGVHAEREDLVTGAATLLPCQPSRADTLEHGFASVNNFFPGTKRRAADLMERIAARFPPARSGAPVVFDDQYIATGGQLYELAVGHDRFVADLRALFYAMDGQPVGLCVHPYDLSALLVAQEAGVVLTDGFGQSLDGPFDVHTPLHWCGYANEGLRQAIAPVVREYLREHGLMNP